MWDLPGAGIKFTSPPLAGGFLITREVLGWSFWIREKHIHLSLPFACWFSLSLSETDPTVSSIPLLTLKGHDSYWIFRITISGSLYSELIRDIKSKFKNNFFFFLPRCGSCRISVPWPGIEPRQWHWKHQVLITRSPGNSPNKKAFLHIRYLNRLRNFELVTQVSRIQNSGPQACQAPGGGGPRDCLAFSYFWSLLSAVCAPGSGRSCTGVRHHALPRCLLPWLKWCHQEEMRDTNARSTSKRQGSVWHRRRTMGTEQDDWLWRIWFDIFSFPNRETGLSGWLSVWRIHLQCRRHRRRQFDPWVGKSPWRRVWQPTPVFLPGESHGQRSLAGYGQ